MQWVERTDQVIGNASETAKLAIDMQTGMRGFLMTGDERFLKGATFSLCLPLAATRQQNDQAQATSARGRGLMANLFNSKAKS